MDRACRTYGRKVIDIGFWWEIQKERDHQEDLHMGWKIILEWILDKYGGVV
jgi:hypothetical protein